MFIIRHIRMKQFLGIVLLIGITSYFTQIDAFAQENRDPFSPPLSDDLKEQEEMNQRVRSIVQDILPEIRLGFDRDIRNLREELEEVKEMRVQNSATSPRNIPGLEVILNSDNNTEDNENTENESGDSSTGGGPLPLNSTFVACINGRALYSDANGNNFFSEAVPETGIRPCSM